MSTFQASTYSGVAPETVSAIGQLVGAAGTIVGSAVQAGQAKKEREHEERMAHKQLLASLAAPPELPQPPSTGLILVGMGGLGVLTLGGLYVLTKDKKPNEARENPLPLLIPLIAAGVGLAATVGGAVAAGKQAKKQREHEEKQAKKKAKQEKELLKQAQEAQLQQAALAAEIAAAQARTNTTIAMVGGVVILGLGGFFLMRRQS